jgi:hypothetical protein
VTDAKKKRRRKTCINMGEYMLKVIGFSRSFYAIIVQMNGEIYILPNGTKISHGLDSSKYGSIRQKRRRWLLLE